LSSIRLVVPAAGTGGTLGVVVAVGVAAGAGLLGAELMLAILII
jgi:hypothetical protein